MYTLTLQWNLSIVDTIGSQHFVPYSEVSLNSWASDILVGMVLRNQAVEHNMAMFSELSLAVH